MALARGYAMVRHRLALVCTYFVNQTVWPLVFYLNSGNFVGDPLFIQNNYFQL